MRSAAAVRSAGRSVPLPVEDRMQKACSAEELWGTLCDLSLAQEHSAHNTDAAMKEDERGDALFALAALARQHR